MGNDNEYDNFMTPRVIVAPATAANWAGSLDAPTGAQYVRGTLEIVPSLLQVPVPPVGEEEDVTYESLGVGRVTNCDFKRLGDLEEIDDGKCGVEAYDFMKLGMEVSLTARYRKTDRVPNMGDFIKLKAPEGKDLADYIFVCTAADASWGLKDLRTMKITGRIHNNLVKEDLISAKINGDGVAVQSVTVEALVSGGGDDPA